MSENTDHGRSIESVQRQISERLSTLNTGFVFFDKRDIEQSISERFEQQVAKHSQRLAVKSRRYQLHYGELNSFANRIAHAILASGSSELPVGLLLENDVPVIATILAVLKAGRVYVPLDAAYPRTRLEYMLEDSQTGLLVTNNRNLGLARELATNKLLSVLNIDELHAGLPDHEVDHQIRPDAAAYILYTSGSTGQPKGIYHSHRNVLHAIGHYTNAFHIGVEDRLTLLHSCSFSSAVVDIFCALLNGGSVFVWDAKQEGFSDLADFLVSEKITLFSWIPTPFRHFVQQLTGKENFVDLRMVVLASEPVYRSDVDLYRKHFSSNCILVNRLGTTETFNYRLCFADQQTEIPENTVPAGYSVPDKEVVLLDGLGKIVSCGDVGEIAVRSPFLALGYWRNPKLTETVFSDLSDGAVRTYLTGDLGRLRSDGCLEYLGRKDFQIKVRGHRIEVSEVEMILRQHPRIRDAAVTGHTQVSGETNLVAYLEPRQGAELTPTDMRGFLKGKLPDHMVPTYFVFLDTLPITPTGKLDRGALPEPEVVAASAERYVAPRTPLEEVLAEIWAGVLKLRRVSIHDSFFDLGGHSLLAAQIVSRVQGALEVDLAVGSFFKDATIAGLSATLIKESRDPARIERTAELLLKLSRLSDNDVEVMLQRTLEHETTTGSNQRSVCN